MCTCKQSSVLDTFSNLSPFFVGVQTEESFYILHDGEYPLLSQVNKQLSRTASMSLTRFCAKQIPNICNNAIPIKIPATTVRFS